MTSPVKGSSSDYLQCLHCLLHEVSFCHLTSKSHVGTSGISRPWSCSPLDKLNCGLLLLVDSEQPCSMVPFGFPKPLPPSRDFAASL